MKKNIIVLGLGRFGSGLAKELAARGLYVTAVDADYTKVEKLANEVSSAVQADMTEEVAMHSLGINNFDVAIIATGSDLEASIEATLICKDSGIKKVIAKASSMTHARILKKIGADQIVYPELDTAQQLARSLSGSDIFEVIHLSDEYSVMEIASRASWVGQSLNELDFRKKYKSNVIAVKREGKIIIDFPSDEKILENDVLMVLGSDENREMLEKSR